MRDLSLHKAKALACFAHMRESEVGHAVKEFYVGLCGETSDVDVADALA
jgi:hypothetical protein